MSNVLWTILAVAVDAMLLAGGIAIIIGTYLLALDAMGTINLEFCIG